MSATTKVWVKVDRAAALRRGINGTDSPVLVELDVTKMTAEERTEMGDRFDVYIDRDNVLRIGDPYLRERAAGGFYRAPMTVVEPSQAGVLAVFAAYRQMLVDAEQRKLDKAQADLAEGVEQLNGEPQRQTLYVWVHLLSNGSFTTSSSSGYGRLLAELRVEYERQFIYTHFGDDATKLACKNRDKQLEAETKQRLDAAVEAAKKQLIAEHLTPRLEWVSVYGSTDLRRMVAEGMEWLPVYEAEREAWQSGIDSGRLISERPGWTVIDASEIQPPKRPRARAWAILDAARLVEPNAKLGIVGKSYVAYAEFCGRTIIWPAD